MSETLTPDLESGAAEGPRRVHTDGYTPMVDADGRSLSDVDHKIARWQTGDRGESDFHNTVVFGLGETGVEHAVNEGVEGDAIAHNGATKEFTVFPKPQYGPDAGGLGFKISPSPFIVPADQLRQKSR